MSGIWSGRVNHDHLAELAALVDAASENNIGVIYASVSKYRDQLTYYIQLTDDARTVLAGGPDLVARKLAEFIHATGTQGLRRPQTGTCLDCGRDFPTWSGLDKYCDTCLCAAQTEADVAAQTLAEARVQAQLPRQYQDSEAVGMVPLAQYAGVEEAS